MTKVAKIEARARIAPQSISFVEAVALATAHFGEPRQRGGSHVVFKTPWQGDPRINLQDKNGSAKPYQVRQLVKAIDQLKESS
ncbi:toxin HicA [uncultured Amnibacterium sp.]|uniref:toxin HicA n=1 Tax=uncultured Amnibacterium sp. TaxID=1631851 RepID=UPI0035C97E4E